MPAANIGIDLGTVNIKVFVKGKGIVMDEPAMVAYDKDADKIRAFGEDARAMIGKMPGNIIAIRPLRQGVVSDYMIVERMLQYFIQKAMGRMTFLKPRVVLCLPSGVTDVERRAVEEAAYQAGARDVTLVKAPVAAALGAGIDIMRPSGSMVVDIGGGVTEIAVLTLGGIALSTTLRVAGDRFSEDIVRYVRDTHDLYIGEGTAEEIKKHIGTAEKKPKTIRMQIKGRSVAAGIPKTISLTSEEVRQAISESVDTITESIRGVLERTSPELAADIVKRGIVLTGGGALLGGIEEKVMRVTGIQTTLAEEPASCVALGTGRYMQAMAELEQRRGR